MCREGSDRKSEELGGYCDWGELGYNNYCI